MPLLQLYLHDKPQQGVNNPQAVFDTLVNHIDRIAQAAAYDAYIYEAKYGSRRMIELLAGLLAHPKQRPAQQ